MALACRTRQPLPGGCSLPPLGTSLCSGYRHFRNRSRRFRKSRRALSHRAGAAAYSADSVVRTPCVTPWYALFMHSSTRRG